MNIIEFIIEDFLHVRKLYLQKYPNAKELTRDFYKKYKHSTISMEKISYNFGSFTELKNMAIKPKKTVSRNEIDVIKKANKGIKKYYVSTIVTGAKVNKLFFNVILNYCNRNNCELVLLVSRGVNIKDTFSEEEYNLYSKYFVTEFKFNDNLIAMDFCLNPQMTIPLTGLNRFGSKEHSVIVSSTKQMMNSIARKKNEFPHLIISTGTISEPDYSNNRQGKLAKQDNTLAGLIVEVESNKFFHIRQIQFDGKGFYDIHKEGVYYYIENKIKKDSAKALIFEPHIGQEDKKAIQFNKEILKVSKCESVFLHDSFDGHSCNPHEETNIRARHIRPSHQKTLFKELNYFGSFLLDLENEFKKTKFYHVMSNHNLFLDRYLESGKFVFNDFNARIGAELFIDLLDGKNPLESYVNRNFNLKRNIFLKHDESFLLSGCEMNYHGHKGSNGTRGNIKNIEVSLTNAFIGHSHAPSIFRGIFQIGCACLLDQDYTKGGTSSSMVTSGLEYNNGKKTLLNMINNKWSI